MSIARAIGKRSKEVVAQLGLAADARSVPDTKEHIAATIAPRLKGWLADIDRQKVESLRPLHERKRPVPPAL